MIKPKFFDTEFHGLLSQLFAYMLISAIVSLAVYGISNIAIKGIFDYYASNPRVLQNISDSYYEQFQEYATKNHVSSLDGRKIADWNDDHSHVSLLISDEDKMIYNSFVSYTMYFEENANASADDTDSFEWGTKDIPVYTYYVQLEDEIAKFRISGYYGLHYSALQKFCSIALLLLSFSLTFFLLFRRKLSYLSKIEDGINTIKNGDYTYSIPVVGSDELATISKSINTLGSTIDMHIKRESEFQKKKDQIIRSIAHDIRTPLTSVIGYMEILKSSLVSAGTHERMYMDKAYNGALHINSLIDDLFDIESTDYDAVLQMENYDGISLLSQIIVSCAGDLETQGFSVEIKNDVKNNFSISANIHYLMRIFNNLESNIFRYGDSTCPVVLKSTLVTESESESSGETSDWLKLELCNAILQEKQAESASLGIGLKSCRYIMELHNGNMDVTTDADANQFTIFLNFPITL